MNSVERIIRTTASLGMATFLTVACDQFSPETSKAASPVAISTSSSEPSGVPTIESRPLSEKRKRGLQLEKVDFSDFQGEKLEQDTRPTGNEPALGKHYLPNFEVLYNQQQLLDLAKECDGQSPNDFQVRFTEKYGLPGYRGQIQQQVETHILLGQSYAHIFIALGTVFENTREELERDFEVSPLNRSQALASLFTYNVNTKLVETICQVRTKSSDEAKRMSADIKGRMLSGILPPAIVAKSIVVDIQSSGSRS